MKFLDLYQSNVKSVKSGLHSLWCSEACTEKQKGYAEQLKSLIDSEIFSSENYEPLVQSMEYYESASDEDARRVFEVIDENLWKRCQESVDRSNGTFKLIPKNKYFTPYKHQMKAWESLTAPDCRSMVVTTGTGSGKTECFMVPLVNELKNAADGTHTVKAIFLYPLNALMEDQKERLQKLLEDGGERKLTFAVYNGNLPDAKNGDNNNDIDKEKKDYPNIVATRNELHKGGADIILTNPTMLEYMLIRDKDQHLFKNKSLRWIVVDEAHTFTGAAATELSMLLRRVINAFGVDKDRLHFAASSATIGNEQDKVAQENALRKFISDISGIDEIKVDIIKGNRNKYNPTEDTEFTQCKKKLIEAVCDYIKLSELLPDYNSIEERLRKLDEFCEQGLRAKVHFFYRVANSGIRVQLDNWADQENGLLQLQTLMPIDPKATPALEVVRCNHCGEYIAIGEYSNDDVTHYHSATNGDEELFDLDSEKSNKLFFGVVPTNSPQKEDNVWVSIKGNEYKTCEKPSDKWAIVANINRLCPHCSAKLYANKKDKEATTQTQEDPEEDRNFKATRLRISAEFVARLMAPGMLDKMKAMGNIPHEGQQYISFVDSRQAAAKGTFNQNVEVEKNWVYSRIFHNLLERSSNFDITKKKQEISAKIQKAQSEEDWDLYGKLSTEFAKLNAQHPNTADKDYLEWIDIFKEISKDPISNIICRQFTNQTNEEIENDEINSVVKDRYIFAVMLSNLAKYPPFQASAETMGLFMSYYPKLDNITEEPDAVKEFNQKYNVNIELEDWKNLLKIYLDRIPRSNESIYLKLDNYLHCDIFNCSERFGLQRPPHRTARKPILNDKCTNTSLVPLLLAKVISPQSDDLLDVVKKNRAEINSVIEAMWKDLFDYHLLQYSECIKSNRSSKRQDDFTQKKWDFDKDSDKDEKDIPQELRNPDGKQLRLNVADIAFKLPNKVYYCEILEKGGKISHIRPTFTTFMGFSPYPQGNKITKPIEKELWDTRYEYINGEDSEHHKVSREVIEHWLKENRKKMYDYGLLGEDGCFNTRVLTILSNPQPFIQAEHTAQVEKKLSRRTQELFKGHKLNILACSTTMEMGVDLGDLELVVMESIPPHPANYKQRAGRSGRNDDSRSACITLCSSDAVGHRVLRDPMQTIIQRKVEMPFVDWDSPSIIQRHVNAFLYRESKLFFSDDKRSSLNWSLIDIFSNYQFHEETGYDKNGRPYHYSNIWDLRDGNNDPVFPKEKNPLGDASGTKYEQFSLWLENDAHPTQVDFLLKDTDFAGKGNQFIDKCSEEWKKRYDDIERELAYYGKQYEIAYQNEKSKNGDMHAKANGELDTGNGRRLLIKFNSILNRRLIDYLATHRFTPNANMPVDVVEFDVYHNKKDLYKGQKLLSNPSYPLQQALSQYAPGNMIVKENRVIRVAGAEYFGKDTSHDRTVFYTDGDDVVGAESQKTIDDSSKVNWPVNGKKELELVLVKSFIPDINQQDSRVLDPSPYTTVNAYLVGAEDWNSSAHHLMSARCNLDAGDAKILYYNNGIKYGYCMCPACGKMELENAPCPSGKMTGIPSAMISEMSKNGYACHYAIDRVEDNGKPKFCIPPKNQYYRNVIIGGLIQTDFCEMRIKKANGSPVNKNDDKAFLTTLGLVLCRAFTEHIGKDRTSVDFTIMMNGNLCIFDTNPGGSGYSNKLADSHYRLAVIQKSKEMLESTKDKEELLDKFTVRYLNDIDIETTLEWLKKELQSWDNTPDNVKGSRYSSAKWANIIDILKDFKASPNDGVLFCNNSFDKWNYMSPDMTEIRQTWVHRVREIIQSHAIIPNKVDLVVPTDNSIPTEYLSMLPQNGWLSIYSTKTHMDDGFYPLACVNGHFYFTDEPETASMNGEWAKGSVFCISPDAYDFNEKQLVRLENAPSTCVFNIETDETKKCDSDKLAGLVLEMAKGKGLAIDDFFKYCNESGDPVQITYVDEHFKSVTGMIVTMHFIDTLLEKMGRKDNFHVKFVNEKYYTASSEVYSPWLNIEKWERRNSILERLANNWIMTKYSMTENEATGMWENDCQNEKSLAHWRVLTIECGNKKLNIYPHGGIINEWQVDRRKDRSRRYTMDDTTEKAIPLIRINPIMYIIELEEK